MSLCARAVALWLAASALAARAQADHLRPSCVYTTCERVDGFDSYSITNKGSYQLVYVKVDEKSESLEWMCPSLVSLDDPALPRFSYPEKFAMVTLHHCRPGNTSYAAAFEKLKISVDETLTLKSLPTNTRFTAASFAGLPKIQVLRLESDDEAVLELETNALTGFNELQELELIHVRADRLPKVSKLSLNSVEILPAGTFDVEVLEINDDNITSINASAAQPKSAKLTMNSLVSLVLHHTRHELNLNQVVENCPALEVLEFHYPRSSKLPADLLKHASKLKTFVYTYGIITELPTTLFDHSPDLQVIDISHNRVTSLPDSLLWNLTKLEKLRLAGNNLSARDFRAIKYRSGGAAALTTLDLSENPLMDLCPESVSTTVSSFGNELLALKSLQELYLAHTHASRVCGDWIHHLHQLRHLDLRGNHVTRITCEDMRARSSNGSITVVDLRNNPLKWLDCSLDDSKDFDDGGRPKQIELITDSDELFDCYCPYLLNTPLRMKPALKDSIPGKTNKWHYIVGSVVSLAVVATAIGSAYFRSRLRGH